MALASPVISDEIYAEAEWLLRGCIVNLTWKYCKQSFLEFFLATSFSLRLWHQLLPWYTENTINKGWSIERAIGIKWTVSRDFRPSVFFTNQLSLGHRLSS
jgi:hypothetical protein